MARPRKYSDEDRKYRAVWQSMIQRCYNKNHAAYGRYGGRGIDVCDYWKASPDNFIRDMGPRPVGGTLDRIDNNGGYSKENCRWASRREQQRNISTNVTVEIDGDRRCISEWCEVFKTSYPAVLMRVKKYGWDPVDAITTPLKKRDDSGVVIDGVWKTVKDWCRVTGVNHVVAYGRISSGMDRVEAVTRPVAKKASRATGV